MLSHALRSDRSAIALDCKRLSIINDKICRSFLPCSRSLISSAVSFTTQGVIPGDSLDALQY